MGRKLIKNVEAKLSHGKLFRVYTRYKLPNNRQSVKSIFCRKKLFEKHYGNLVKFYTNSHNLSFLFEICAIITLTFGSDLASTGVEWLRWHTALDKALKVRQNLNANNAKFAPAYAKIA